MVLCFLFARKGAADFIGMQNIRPSFDSPIAIGHDRLRGFAIGFASLGSRSLPKVTDPD
jgi:hypothetical protein